MKKKISRREDYLKLIYALSKKGEVHDSDLAIKLDMKRQPGQSPLCFSNLPIISKAADFHHRNRRPYSLFIAVQFQKQNTFGTAFSPNRRTAIRYIALA